MEVAFAKVYKYDVGALKIPEAYYEDGKKQENIDAIWDTLLRGRAQMQELYSQLSLEDETQAAIFEAHIRILEDEELLDKVLGAIELDGFTAEYAISKVFDEYICAFEESEDPILRDKVFDLKDMKAYLMRLLRGAFKQELAKIEEEIILVAKELMPSEVLLLDPKYVKGIITEKGSIWSHVAILAKARQIPIETGVEGIWDKVHDGDLLPVKPNPEIQYCETEVLRKDGCPIKIGINIDGPDWELSEECYDYVGLYRTEFQYMANMRLPREEELFETYKQVVMKAGDKLVTFRTIDMGEDKIPEYLAELVGSENIERGVQFCFHNPEVFLTQLRAILRASAYGKVQIMFPMIRSMEDIIRSKSFVKEAMKELEQTGQDFDRDVPIGIMIETLEITKQIDQVIDEVDFASVGTNDLMKSIGGSQLFVLLGGVFSVFEQANKPISVCGELASDSYGAVELVRMGAKNLSMCPTEVAQTKTALKEVFYGRERY